MLSTQVGQTRQVPSWVSSPSTCSAPWQMTTAESNIFRRVDGALDFLIERRPLYDACCHTVHLVLACPSATDYSPKAVYTAERAWFCGQPTIPSAGARRCARHWFSQFVCYAADSQPVAIANTSAQLAELLGVPAVFLLDANTRQPLDINGALQPNSTAAVSRPRAPAAASRAIQAAEGSRALQQQGQAAIADMEVEPPPPAAQYNGDTVSLEVPEPQGTWTTTACAALFIVLDVDSTQTFQHGHRYTIMQNCRCGNESGKQVFCGKHRKAAHIYLLAKNGDLVWAGNTLPELAPVLAITNVRVQDPLGDLEAKLTTENAAADATAAAASTDSSSNGEQQQPASAAAPQGTTAAAVSVSNVPTVLRLEFTPEQIAAGALPDVVALSHLQPGYADVQLSIGATCCTVSPCMGLNLRLAVSNLQDLASSSGPVLVAAGRRCGNEGGTKRCCKQHKSTLILLTDQQGSVLPGAANFDGLASILKVSSVQLLDSCTLRPLPEYQQLPPSIRWQVSPDRVSFRVWVPQDYKQKTQPAAGQEGVQQPDPIPPGQQHQNAEGTGRQCFGLDLTVALQQGQAHAMGTPLPVLSVTRCGNQCRGDSAACRRHQGGLLHLVAQGPGGQTAFQVCRNLGELAIWLGVQQVEILDSDTGQPIDSYKFLVPAPVQLSMPGQTQHQQQLSSLAPPSLLVQPPQAHAAAAAVGSGTASAAEPAATAARMDVDQQQPVPDVPSAAQPSAAAAAAAHPGQSAPAAAALGQGNCGVEQLSAPSGDGSSHDDVQGYVIKVLPRPVRTGKSNPCRALDVTVLMAGGQTVWTPGQSQYSISAVQRCGNEAGSKSRCKQHTDAAIRLLALASGDHQQHAAPGAAVLGPYQLQQQIPALVARLNSNAELAQQLGVLSVTLRCKDTGEDLGDVSTWSPSTHTGTAAKVQQVVAAASPELPAPVTVPLPQLLQTTLGNVVLPSSMQVAAQQQQHNKGQLVEATEEAAPAATATSSAPVASRLGLHEPGALTLSNDSSNSTYAQQLGTFGLITPVTTMIGYGVQHAAHSTSAPIVLQSSAIAASIAAGDGEPAAGAPHRAVGLDAGFSTSAPLAKLASMFKAPQPNNGP